MFGLDDGDGVHGPVALVDLGDTLCECTPALLAGLAQLREPGDLASDETRVPLPAYMEARRRQVMSLPGFWRGLRPRASGFAILGLLREAGFRAHIVTKGPQDPAGAWADKVAWCRTHLPGFSVTVTDDKSRVHGHVLVEDWIPYVTAWQRQWPTALAIVPVQPWNADAELGPHGIHYDGSNGEEILSVLHDCRVASGCSAPRPADPVSRLEELARRANHPRGEISPRPVDLG